MQGIARLGRIMCRCARCWWLHQTSASYGQGNMLTHAHASTHTHAHTCAHTGGNKLPYQQQQRQQQKYCPACEPRLAVALVYGGADSVWEGQARENKPPILNVAAARQRQLSYISHRNDSLPHPRIILISLLKPNRSCWTRHRSCQVTSTGTSSGTCNPTR